MSNFKHVEEIFHAALAMDADEERNQFLDQACDGVPEIRSQVNRLLESHGKASNFMEQSPTLPVEASAMMTDTDVTQAPKSAGQSDFRIDDRLPRFFGDYELLEKIAHGGMGVVFKARQASLNRIVAIKMILSGQFAGQDEIQRFYIEAEAAGKLDHAGIVPVFDVGCHQGQHYLSMAFVDGQSLAAKIRHRPLPPREAATLAKKLAIAMQFAHDHGIVHRDLKPGNVLMDCRDEPRVTDFGLAKRVEGDSNLTRTGMVLGTPGYMPPEQAVGKKTDTPADVYSLGAILYAMLTGRPPFEGGSQLETILQVIQNEPVAPRKIYKRIPKDLEAICLKCLEKRSASRYATAAELAADLQRFLSGEPIQAKNDFRRRFRKWTLREPVLAAHILATCVLMFIIFVAWLLLGATSEDLYVLWKNYAILGAWAFTIFLFQKAQNGFQTKFVIPYAWSAVNPVFLTITLCLNSAPRGTLLSLYFLMIVTSCFFRRVELVATTTIASLVGYAILVGCFFTAAELTHRSYLMVFGVNLAVTGYLLALLSLRLKRLGEQHSS